MDGGLGCGFGLRRIVRTIEGDVNNDSKGSEVVRCQGGWASLAVSRMVDDGGCEYSERRERELWVCEVV